MEIIDYTTTVQKIHNIMPTKEDQNNENNEFFYSKEQSLIKEGNTEKEWI